MYPGLKNNSLDTEMLHLANSKKNVFLDAEFGEDIKNIKGGKNLWIIPAKIIEKNYVKT